MKINSLAAWFEQAAEQNLTPARWVLAEQAAESGGTQAEVLLRLEDALAAMEQAILSYRADRRSDSGLSGGQGAALEARVAAGETLMGPFMGRVAAAALKMAESNACMGRIVAAPTAGACGVLPAVLLTAGEALCLPRAALMDGLLAAGGVGAVIAARATLSGAQGGCQAEVGSASAMAAAALVTLRGGTDAQVMSAVAFALSNLLGLVCDPVAGLVEVPCVARNVVGAVNAVAAADMALAGIAPAIPADEVIDAMGRVGAALPPSLRETGGGGLAATPAGRAIGARVFGQDGPRP